MAYVEILDSELQPEAPATSALAFKFRDNPEAVFKREVGAPAMAPARLVVLDTGAGNWTVPAGVYGIKVTAIGAGAGAGLEWIAFPGSGRGGAGGGAGGVCILHDLTVEPGDVIAYSVGAAGVGKVGAGAATDGGDTTFIGGAISLTAGGGKKGAVHVGGDGGTAAGGDIDIPGQRGQDSATSSTGLYNGDGGSCLHGNGGRGIKGAGTTGQAGQGFGAGGGGGTNTGGDGAGGVILIEY